MTKTKKLIPVLFALLACLVLFAASASAYTLGDVDANGKIAAADARLALRAAVQLEKFGKDTASDKFKAADVDHNGKITAADARMILRVAVKLDTFPAAPSETPTADGCTHTWVYTTNRSNKGVVTGTHTAKCSKCGQTKTENCAYGEKTYTSKDESGKIITKPTCTKGTSYTQTCALCKGVKASVGEAALNHKNKKLVASKSKAATCTEDGWNFYTCPDCGLDGSTTNKKAKAVLCVTLKAPGHTVSSTTAMYVDKENKCTRCNTVFMPAFNDLVNAIKTRTTGFSMIRKENSSGSITPDSYLKWNRAAIPALKLAMWADGQATGKSDEEIEKDIQEVDEMMNDENTMAMLTQDLVNPQTSYTGRLYDAKDYKLYPIEGNAALVSKLAASDLKNALKIEYINGVDFLNEIEDSIRIDIGNNRDYPYDATIFKALADSATGNIMKVTADVKDEQYTKLSGSADPALTHCYSLDIRELAKANPIGDAMGNESSDEMSFDINAKCHDVWSSAKVIYYFKVTEKNGVKSYTPVGAKYVVSPRIRETIDIKFSLLNIGEGLLNGHLDMTINYVYTDYILFN